ncbi:hypothetical protein PHYSODRAFT_301678 [Phytophthora sojae]|uniref:Uncharacterized protein n=1 Tax=Phytophthora sojae (strain P6497) TaxID=1094619 RepID=G4ZKY6_PHYSP|nr:hypothetical protein PHYSODRAFT_301678 [Phytophthora sojae]EGZ14904.1 hypothetical protein PHYSODRAFT_301678 [Phytophthora sojae]|eukprot:XP_009528653.1 hypothetical protein PHYSODRAFT_301678 [Phytophthora sojae]
MAAGLAADTTSGAGSCSGSVIDTSSEASDGGTGMTLGRGGTARHRELRETKVGGWTGDAARAFASVVAALPSTTSFHVRPPTAVAGLSAHATRLGLLGEHSGVGIITARGDVGGGVSAITSQRTASAAISLA